MRSRSIDLKYQRLTKKNFSDQPSIANQPPLRTTFYDVNSLLHQALFQHYLQLSPPDLASKLRFGLHTRCNPIQCKLSTCMEIVKFVLYHREFQFRSYPTAFNIGGSVFQQGVTSDSFLIYLNHHPIALPHT